MASAPADAPAPMPPHRTAFSIRSPRLQARCWSPDDASDFRALLDRNDSHLRPFIPWMRDEPMPLAATRERLHGYRERFLAGLDYRYALFDAGGHLVGELMLSTRSGPGSREVGYLLDRAVTGRGFATEAAAMALRVAFEIDRVGRVLLICSPENAASVRVAEKLGFVLDHVREAEYTDSEGLVRDSLFWVLPADRYRHSPAATLAVRAFDQAGASLPWLR
ncbi:MAG TPA: GNAT family N-acetyltransferase [Xanthomonadaceae bacterium]|nr:GNAT family N-acetyltransferase [Xanthomonadaceae bacterium]